MAGLIEELKRYNSFEVRTTDVVLTPAWPLALFFARTRAALIPEGIQSLHINREPVYPGTEPGRT